MKGYSYLNPSPAQRNYIAVANLLHERIRQHDEVGWAALLLFKLAHASELRAMQQEQQHDCSTVETHQELIMITGILLAVYLTGQPAT